MKQIYNWQKATVFDIEEWRDCPVFPQRYEVSSLGNVRNKPYLKTGRNINGFFTFGVGSSQLKPYKTKGYLQVVLSYEGQKITRKVHRLVAEAFIENPNNKPEVNHKDSDRANNCVSNLEWVTGSENVKHSYHEGSNTNKGEYHPRKVLNDETVKLARALHKNGMSYMAIARELGFNYHTVRACIVGQNWSHVK